MFPDRNDEVALIRQVALLAAPDVNNPKEFLDELRTGIIQPQLPGSNGPAVRIMSLHKSKGLTAKSTRDMPWAL